MSRPSDARLPGKHRLADQIRDKIKSGEYKPGDQLPSIPAIEEQFGYGEGTVRAALEILKQDGRIESRQGKGNFVRSRPHARRHGIDRYRRSVWMAGPLRTAEAAEQGRKSDQLMRYVGPEPAPAGVAERLGVEPGTIVHARKRTTRLDGRPDQLADSYYTEAITDAAPMLRETDTEGGGFARLAQVGHAPERIREEISIRMPEGTESADLEMPPGTPVAEVYRTAYDAAGQPVEVMLAVIAGDMAAFDYEFPVPE